MRGDMQKIIDQINPVFETVFARLDELEKKLEEAKEPPKAEPKKKVDKE